MLKDDAARDLRRTHVTIARCVSRAHQQEANTKNIFTLGCCSDPTRIGSLKRVAVIGGKFLLQR